MKGMIRLNNQIVPNENEKNDNFDDVVNLCKYIKLSLMKYKIFVDKNTLLYEFKNNYYIVFKNVNLGEKNAKKFCSSIAEFGIYVQNPELFDSKLAEYGNKIIPKNVINTVSKKF